MTTVAEPEHIAISKSKGIKIDWIDGHHSDYSTAYLRDECPCAACTGAHGTEPQKTSHSSPKQELLPMYKPRIAMTHIEEAGHYALHIYWNDGHNSGIYSFDHLRRICPCEECRKAREL
ncbi:MAG TPA: DUF971 domain-containing protein [Bryobacteraceae bacterium]|jgi:DUF971 family protein|nr:DUF971 domain-containing protein [Bryobacteraceae bacterium]